MNPIRTLYLPIIPYTPAQHAQTQNTQPTLTINTLQTLSISKYTTSRNITRPPLQTIPTNPLSYNLTSTNPNPTKHSTINNYQLNTLNPPSTAQIPNTTDNTLQPTQFPSSHSQSTTIRTNPHFHNTYSQPLPNTQIITSNASHTPTYNTIPNKPFDGIDHNFTPEENLQHIEARDTFSLGLQPLSAHEYKKAGALKTHLPQI